MDVLTRSLANQGCIGQTSQMTTARQTVHHSWRKAIHAKGECSWQIIWKYEEEKNVIQGDMCILCRPLNCTTYEGNNLSWGQFEMGTIWDGDIWDGDSLRWGQFEIGIIWDGDNSCEDYSLQENLHLNSREHRYYSPANQPSILLLSRKLTSKIWI